MSEARRTPGASIVARWTDRRHLCGLFCLLLFCGAAHAQDEGARAYELAPVGSQAIDLYGLLGRGDFDFNPGVAVGGAEISLNGGIIEYAHGFALAGRAGTFLVSLPFGEASSTVSVASAARNASMSGTGDLQLTAAFGLLGSPALSEKDYESYRPRAALTLLTRVYVPTGRYDRNSPVNLGQHRWAVQLGVPLAFYLGDSFLDPSLTSFELIPSVIGYGDNDEPSSGNNSHQAPLMQVEGHITRNLNRNLWVSLDALAIEGGERTTDGVSDHNRQRSVALGATGSFACNDVVTATLSYTKEVSRNNPGGGGHIVRLLIEIAL